MSEIRDIFISNLKYFRKKKNMTQTMLSVQLDKSMNYIAGVENRALFPPPETIDQIAKILGIRPSQLFDENGSPQNVRSNSRREFAKELSEELTERLSSVIRKEIHSALSD